jgi:hypothetical protein
MYREIITGALIPIPRSSCIFKARKVASHQVWVMQRPMAQDIVIGEGGKSCSENKFLCSTHGMASIFRTHDYNFHPFPDKENHNMLILQNCICGIDIGSWCGDGPSAQNIYEQNIINLS